MIDVRDDGTGMMTREAWDIIQSLGGYTEVSRSITGAYVFMKRRIPGDVDRREIMEELDECGHVEIYGYPTNGRVVGTTWLHIKDTPRHTVSESQNVIDELVDEYVDEEDQMSDQEQATVVIERHKSQIRDDQSGRTQSKHYDLDPVPIANTGPSRTYGRNGQGPHPVHGATRFQDNPGPDDKDSTNFGVDCQKGGSAGPTTTAGVRSS